VCLVRPKKREDPYEKEMTSCARSLRVRSVNEIFYVSKRRISEGRRKGRGGGDETRRKQRRASEHMTSEFGRTFVSHSSGSVGLLFQTIVHAMRTVINAKQDDETGCIRRKS